MVKNKTRTTVFLIVDKNALRKELAGGLTTSGYDVHDYMTVNEFLIDKKNHTSGVVVAECRLRGVTGQELCEMLKSESEAFPVVLIASNRDFPTAIASSATELVLQPIDVQSVNTAIARVIEGDDISESEVARGFRRLTEREFQILELVVAGKSSMDVAEMLDISHKTVEAFRARIKDKTRAQDVWELVRMWRVWKQMDKP